MSQCAGGGGGYLAGSPFGGSAGGSPGLRGRGAAAQSLRPCSVKQLLNATQAHTDAEWRIDDVEIGQVTVVAQVVTINSQATNCVYWLDDGTGRIEARHWVDTTSSEETDKWGGITENTYVRATGSLKAFGNRRHINATHLRAIKDPHEIYFHTLETIHTVLTFEKGPPGGPGQSPATQHGNAGPSAYSAQAHSASNNAQFSHLPTLQRKIIDHMIEEGPVEGGLDVGSIARAVGVSNAHTLSAALDALMDEGHIFSTTDDSHFSLSV
ncbi:hypothetical protein JAAARDRAFT_67377 [Jaapia argillacea MUCL 33604]|uniref:Replication protein A C-terminal domain-containing protein n=1 Tax=Jaapia argillacea MUCL 33604 TaxID=933084 RepID=A0A067QEE9_9AGAM|nr:hypothetical protein JAAARDRAFT_67377 [Jaapia argillacea MUCL 33604]